MPVSGLSMVLENMVMAVMKTHALKTWNLFHEDNGNLTFRLKFEHIQELPIVQDSEVSRTDSQGTISFKKKNAKQVSRDKARSRKRRRVRQSTSSIETNREQLSSDMDSHLDTLDISSPFGHQIEENEETFESTRLSALMAPPVLDEDSEPDTVASVNITEALIEVPPKPDYTVIEDNIIDDKTDDVSDSDAEESKSDTSASDSSSDDSCDSQSLLAEIVREALKVFPCTEPVPLDRESDT